MSGKNPFRPNAKRVRIQTPPPLSPDSISPEAEDSAIQRFGPAGHTSSPPPSPFSAGRSQFDRDPFSESFADDVISREALDNTRRNAEQSLAAPSSSSSSTQAAASTDFTASVPTLSKPQPPPGNSTSLKSPEPRDSQARSVANPFRRTLADLEPQNGARSFDQPKQSTKPSEALSAEPLDVDSFTKMMIGDKQAGPSHPPLQFADSPKAQKAKPAPPRHRYGKSLSLNGPVTGVVSSPPHSPSFEMKASPPAPQRQAPAKAVPPPPPPPRRSGFRNSSGASSDQTSISETASSASSPPPADESPLHDTNPYRRHMRARSQSAASG